ncbi:Tat pathway signal protein [Brevundimonas sp.]|uniref:Tat pathway signal protein n=1 Tax=Brevundimonas sp. TaxID=1871086 RepID=UPI002ED86D76
MHSRDDITPDHQQMDLSNDPEEAARLKALAQELAMKSRQRLTGSATGVGSVGFDESGAFDVGAADDDPDHPEPGAPPFAGRL